MKVQSAKILLLPSKCGIIFSIAKVVALNVFASIFVFVDWFIASFLYCFPYSYRSSNYCSSNSCRSFTLLKALAKSNGNIIAIAFKSEKERDSWKSDNFIKEAIKKAIIFSPTVSWKCKGEKPIHCLEFN